MNGVVAAFETEAMLEGALDRLRAAQVGRIETYTPKALAADETGAGSIMPVLILVAGIIGAAGMYGLETYADVLNWPVNVGGRPAFSWPAFVPIAFEVGVLFAISTGFFGYFIINRLPRLWDPVDECAAMRQAMRAEWVVAVWSDERPQLLRARRIIDSLHPLSVDHVGEALMEVPA
ncbi:MAG TPA: DUF3341 domain-containing protein [Acetobacteraceae bacterium]|nr:DUF3341 domain-containing protein [Acetobacteraceae bacterium]